MRAITPLGRALLVVVAAAIVGLLVGSAGLQIAALIVLVLAPAWGVSACVNSGQGRARLYDPERRRHRRPPSDTGAIADAVARGQADGGANAAAYAGSRPNGH